MSLTRGHTRKYQRRKDRDGELTYTAWDGNLKMVIVRREGREITKAFGGEWVYEVWAYEGEDATYCGYRHTLREAKALVELNC